jgi:acetoacetyl-CoA synthetase
MQRAVEGDILWEPSQAYRERTEVARFMRWLAAERIVDADSYDALWHWSVTDLETFWASVWRFFDVRASAPYTRVLSGYDMPGAKWFEGARLNYAEHVFRHDFGSRTAIVQRSELRPHAEISWNELRRQVGAVAASLRALGVTRGDRVASYMPNIPETVIAMLAVTSLGAIWSSCSPDMGSGAVTDRFRQIEPKLLFAVDGYRYGGRDFDRRPVLREIVAALPTLDCVVMLPYLDATATAAAFPGGTPWSELARGSAPLVFEQVPADHPIWVLYSSGTTGLPKPIVHGHGGILVEHLKTLALHQNIHAGDRLFWISSTGWVVWNLLASALLVGGSIVCFDGNPAWPDPAAIWRHIAETRTQHFGCGAALFAGAIKAGVEPARVADLSALEGISSTGSPLTADAFQWAYEHVKRDLWLASISGGTDIAGGFVGGCPLLPVTAGEIQCRLLGVDAQAWDEQGRSIVGEVGELVIAKPMPSMPTGFWNDPGDRRYRESYFEMFPGKWRHGDWIRFTDRGTSVIYGRSDTTINRHGIRMGTADIYRAVEEIPEVLDSLVVDLEYLGRPSFMPLFVVLREGVVLDDALKARIAERIRTHASARHVPNEIYAVAEVPRTLTGKKMELPVRKLLLGAALEKVASPDAMANPASLAEYADFATRINKES